MQPKNTFYVIKIPETQRIDTVRLFFKNLEWLSVGLLLVCYFSVLPLLLQNK